ncbi:MAG: hypothetical protein Q7R95_11480 [bacterium]|nr:hypothetical protein [bacterium]
MKNQNRHLKRNLGKSLDLRQTVEQDNGRVLNLCASRTLRAIRNEIAPKSKAFWQTYDLLDRTVRQKEKQGYSKKAGMGGAYKGHLFALGSIEAGLDKVNDTFASVRSKGMEQARQETIASANAVNQANQ